MSGLASSYLTLVETNIRDLCELDLELPVVGLLVNDLKPGVTAVGLPPVGQQVGICGLVNSFQPRNLQENQFKKKTIKMNIVAALKPSTESKYSEEGLERYFHWSDGTDWHSSIYSYKYWSFWGNI